MPSKTLIQIELWAPELHASTHQVGVAASEKEAIVAIRTALRFLRIMRLEEANGPLDKVWFAAGAGLANIGLKLGPTPGSRAECELPDASLIVRRVWA